MKRIFTVIARYMTAMGLVLPVMILPQGQAQTFTIGKGSGIVLEGILPFSVTGTVTPKNSGLDYRYDGVAAFGSLSSTCMNSSMLKQIGGYLAFPIGNGLGIIPRATVSATYELSDGTLETMSGTIGLPETRGKTSSGYDITTGPGTGSWCLPPRMNDYSNFYSVNHENTVSAEGDWTLVADGTQQSTIMDLGNSHLFFVSRMGRSYIWRTLIAKGANDIRVSTLECTVDTPTQIDFGTVPYLNQPGTELAIKSNTLSTQCNQDASATINTNINLQIRSLSGFHEGNTSHLALNQGGGYITGEISNGVTGSGVCSANTGVVFDSRAITLGTISTEQTSQSLFHEVTWRLCSGGSDLPTGPVTASAELLVTFN
ncbi:MULTISPECIES: adhesin [Enterobacter]